MNIASHLSEIFAAIRIFHVELVKAALSTLITLGLLPQYHCTCANSIQIYSRTKEQSSLWTINGISIPVFLSFL